MQTPTRSRPFRRRPVGVCSLALLALLLAACSGASASAPTASPTPAAAVSTSTPVSASATSPSMRAAPATTAQANASPPMPVNPQANVGATTTIQNPGVVSWVHIGDLHITTADQQNYKDLQTIIAQTNQYLKNGVNFAVLPGDNANDDTEAEYQLIKQATDQLQVPLYAVPGDHDHKSGLTNYNKYLEPTDYYSFSAGGYHFAFLDVMSGISADEKTWLTSDLDAAAAAGLKNVLVMHSFTIASQLQDLIQKDGVILVDSGHTHYNDVANDGQTIYAAGRNTGQVTEGPVGFTMLTLDNGVVSWKFKPLGTWPFVMITSPSDKQLMINGAQVVHGTTDIRAKIWDDKGVASATYQIDGGTAAPMQQIGTTQMWSVPFDSTKVSEGDHKITVTVQGAGGNTSDDTITVTVNQSGTVQLPQRSFGPAGNDIGAYTEKGLLGNQTAGGPGGGKGAPGGPACTPAVNPATASTAAASSTTSSHNNGALNASATPPATSQPAGTQTAATCAPAGPGGKGHGPATITAVTGNQVTVQYQDGTTQTVTVSSSTQIVKEVSGSVADLKPGETVDLPGVVSGTGQSPTTIKIHAATGAP